MVQNNILINLIPNTTTFEDRLLGFNTSYANDLSRIVIMPINNDSNDNYRSELVFLSTHLYLQGFILINRNNESDRRYFHFSDAQIPRLDDIDTNNTYDLNFDGDYGTLGRNGEISWDSIVNSYNQINNMLTNREIILDNNTHRIRYNNGDNFMRISLRSILLTSTEAIRTGSIRNMIQNLRTRQQNNPRPTVSWSNDINNIVINWDQNSRNQNTRNANNINVISTTAQTNQELNNCQPSTSGIRRRDRNRVPRKIQNCLQITSIGILKRDSTLSSYVKSRI